MLLKSATCINIRRLVQESRKRVKKSRVVLAFVAATLAANVSSRSSLSPKMRTHKSSQVTKIFRPVNKASSGCCFSSPSPSASNKVSSFKVKPAITSFPTILATPSIESFQNYLNARLIIS